MHLLKFDSQTSDRSSVVIVQIEEQKKVIRHAMGRTEEPGGAYINGAVLVVVGVTAALLGGIAIGAGSSEHKPEELRQTGLIVTAVGGILTLGGAGLMVVGQPTRQPGSTTEFAYEAP